MRRLTLFFKNNNCTRTKRWRCPQKEVLGEVGVAVLPKQIGDDSRMKESTRTIMSLSSSSSVECCSTSITNHTSTSTSRRILQQGHQNVVHNSICTFFTFNSSSSTSRADGKITPRKLFKKTNRAYSSYIEQPLPQHDLFIIKQSNSKNNTSSSIFSTTSSSTSIVLLPSVAVVVPSSASTATCNTNCLFMLYNNNPLLGLCYNNSLSSSTSSNLKSPSRYFSSSSSTSTTTTTAKASTEEETTATSVKEEGVVEAAAAAAGTTTTATTNTTAKVITKQQQDKEEEKEDTTKTTSSSGTTTSSNGMFGIGNISYVKFAQDHPFINNLLIATAKTAAADLMAQTVIGGTPLLEIDLQRSLLFCMFGFVYLGGFQYFYQIHIFKKLFQNIDQFTSQSWSKKLSDVPGLKALGAQTALDLTVLSFIYLPTFYIFKASVFSGSMDPTVWVSSGLATYTANFVKDEIDLIKVWLPADLVCFSVPLYLRLPVRHIVSFVWTAYLSFARGGH